MATDNPLRRSPCLSQFRMLVRVLKLVLLSIGAACVLWLWHVFIIMFTLGACAVLYFWFKSLSLFKEQQ